MTFILIEYAAFLGNRKEGKRGVSSKLATAQDLLQPFGGREDGCAILAFGLSHCVTSLGGYQHGETSAYLDVGGTNAGIAEPSAERGHVWKASSDTSDVDDIANHKPQDSTFGKGKMALEGTMLMLLRISARSSACLSPTSAT